MTLNAFVSKSIKPQKKKSLNTGNHISSRHQEVDRANRSVINRLKEQGLADRLLVPVRGKTALNQIICSENKSFSWN